MTTTSGVSVDSKSNVMSFQTCSAAQPIDDEQRGDLANARLDRRERDELGVELVEHGLDVDVVEDARELRRWRLSGSERGHASLR